MQKYLCGWHFKKNILCSSSFLFFSSGHLFYALSCHHTVRLGQEVLDDSGLCPDCSHCKAAHMLLSNGPSDCGHVLIGKHK